MSNYLDECEEVAMYEDDDFLENTSSFGRINEEKPADLLTRPPWRKRQNSEIQKPYQSAPTYKDFQPVKIAKTGSSRFKEVHQYLTALPEASGQCSSSSYEPPEEDYQPATSVQFRAPQVPKKRVSAVKPREYSRETAESHLNGLNGMKEVKRETFSLDDIKKEVEEEEEDSLPWKIEQLFTNMELKIDDLVEKLKAVSAKMSHEEKVEFMKKFENMLQICDPDKPKPASERPARDRRLPKWLKDDSFLY